MIIKQLTKKSWLINSEIHGNVGLVFQREGVFISTHSSDKVYTSLDEIAAEFNEKLIEKSIQEEKSKIDVFGYPVRHTEVFDMKNDSRPTYKVKEDSDIRYVAGYWILFFDGKYRVAQCPKESTITAQCSGPYLDKFTANAMLNNISKKKTAQ